VVLRVGTARNESGCSVFDGWTGTRRNAGPRTIQAVKGAGAIVKRQMGVTRQSVKPKRAPDAFSGRSAAYTAIRSPDSRMVRRLPAGYRNNFGTGTDEFQPIRKV
jgi:hypothetical protein